MKKEFVDYLKSIGITAEEYLKRIETIIEVFSDFCQEEIVDIFVDEYIKEDGTREYEDITFFSEHYIFGATQFLTSDDFTLFKRMKNISSIDIKKKDYDFKKATDKSRLNIEIFLETASPLHGNYKASKENCDSLKHILENYFLSDLVS